MQAHDFLRKAIRAVSENLEKNQAYFTHDYIVRSMQMLHEAQRAVKFVMPTDGQKINPKDRYQKSFHQLEIGRAHV